MSDVVTSEILVEQLRSLARQNAALRWGYIEDLAAAEALFGRMGAEVDVALRASVKSANETQIERWKLRSLRRRRWWRIGSALGGARRGWTELLLLPFTLGRAVFTKEPVLPRPVPRTLIIKGSKVPSGPADFALPMTRVPSVHTVSGLVDAGDYVEAIQLIDELLSEDPRDLALLAEKLRAHSLQGETAEALDAIGTIQLTIDTDLRQLLGDERALRERAQQDLPAMGDPGEHLAEALAKSESARGLAMAKLAHLESTEKICSAAARAFHIQLLKSERRRIKAEDKLRRLKARRWWQLGGALGSWRRQPLRVDMLLRDVWRTSIHPRALPVYRDLSELDDRIAELSSTPDGSVAGTESRAAAFIAEGAYEKALDVLTRDDDLAITVKGMLLKRDAHMKLGETSKAIADVRGALALKGSEMLRKQERVLVGRIRETHTSWLPDAGPSKRLERVNDDTILHILKESLPFYERGYTIRSMTTLIAQQQAGYTPVVVTSLGFPRQQGFTDFASKETIDGIDHHRLDLGPLYDTTKVPYDLRLSDDAFLTARLAEDIAPEAIQAGSGYRGYETALVGLSVARSIGVPLIYEIRSFLEQTWTAEVDRSESGEYYRQRYNQEVRCLTDADHVITIAEAMKEEIIARGIDSDRVSVVPNAVDTARFAPREKSQELMDRYGLGDRPVLGYVSNLGWREGIQHLVEAVSILRSQGNDVCGLVVGDGPEMDMLRALVDERGLESDFVLTGHVPNPQIEDHYALIDLFVVPRVNDRAARFVTPLKPLEAMSMGKLIIAADLPALRELVMPGERGLIFETENSESLAAVALQAFADTDSTRRLATAGQEWVREERTIATNSVRYRRILESVISGSRSV